MKRSQALERKRVDVKKIDEYFKKKKIPKSSVGPMVYKSKSYVHDIIRRGDVTVISWDKICDILSVPRDYFDIVEEKPEPEVEEETGVILDETDHDILVSLLLSQKKIEALLMEIVSLLK